MENQKENTANTDNNSSQTEETNNNTKASHESTNSENLNDTTKENTETTSQEEKDYGLLIEQNLAFFKTQQNFGKALIAGIVTGLITAILWGVITVVTEYQIGFMAIGVGAAVGLAIRATGKGLDQIFGITGAIISILGCLVGNFLSIIGFAANAEGLGYLEVLSVVDFSMIIPLMAETFSPMDLLFYGIAAYEGYKLSFRTFTEEDFASLADSETGSSTLISKD